MIFLGIDPGQSGGIGIVDVNGYVNSFGFKNMTFPDISAQFDYIRQYPDNWFAYIELVHSMPKQGVASSFAFGKSYGFLIGMLTAHRIPYDYVTPQKWQKELNCMSKGDKNVTKQKAQQLFPGVKFTHQNADAVLIAEYCRRIKS